MSDTTTPKKSTRSAKPAKSFGESTQRLECIISQMDDPNTNLEEMIGLVEEGLKLIKESRKILSQAELRIKKLDQLPAHESKAAAKQAMQPEQTEQQNLNTNEFSLF